MTCSEPNQHLVGDLDARSQLATPALLLDLPTLEHNLECCAKLCRNESLGLRPHFKAHKSRDIAERQLAHGANGLSVATVSEAELVADLGAEILLTSVISSRVQLNRIIKLKRTGAAIILTMDSLSIASKVNEWMAAADQCCDVLVDLDMGRHRSGCTTSEEAARLCRYINQASALQLRGVQAYAGQLSHQSNLAQAQSDYQVFSERLTDMLNVCETELPKNVIVSGGSTGSFAHDGNGPLNELQCGSYALMDIEYSVLPYAAVGGWPFKQCLTVQTTVLSANWPRHVVTDAGDKRFASKYGRAPMVLRGAPAVSVYELLSDEHARLVLPIGCQLESGSRVECLVPHCDPTVNLFANYHVMEGDSLIALWSIGARGV